MAEERDSLDEKARSGDGGDFGDLLANAEARLRRYLQVRMPRELRALESCSDLVQSVFREAWTKRDGARFESHARFLGWLFEFAKHKLQDRVRYWRAARRDSRRVAPLDDGASGTREPSVFASLGSPSGMAMSAEAEALVERAFEALSDDHQEVLSLIHFAELSAQEAGQIMGGREAGAIRSLLNRARIALSTELERLGFRID